MGVRPVTAPRGRRVRGAAAALAVTVLLGACGGSDEGSSTPPSATPSTTPIGTETPPSHIPVGLGETAEVPVVGGTLFLVVRDIEVTTSCPGRAVPIQEPVFGYFVVVDLVARLDNHAATTGPDVPYEVLGAERFRVAGPDGTFQEVSSTDASWACLEDDELAPPFVDAGESVTGKVVLDSASDHGIIVFDSGDPPRLSWQF